MSEVLAGVAARLEKRLYVSAVLVFETGWRIGSGRAGQTSDLGVLLDAAGRPILPGSTIKGRLRSTCETLAPRLGLSACLLNHEASGVACASDVSWFSKHRDAHREAIMRGVKAQLEWIRENTCDVCRLFGSPAHAGRLRCSEGKLLTSAVGMVRVRDGVVLDRDSHTAVDGLKYDYECVSADTRFRLVIDVYNPVAHEEALLGAALFDWSAGNSLGGFTSRGLGRFHLEEIEVYGADFADANQRRQFLLGRTIGDRLNRLGNWQDYFQNKIDQCLSSVEG